MATSSVVKSESKGVTGSEVKEVEEDGGAVAVGDYKQHLEVAGEASEICMDHLSWLKIF